MAEEKVSALPAIAGFGVVSGAMMVCLGLLLMRAPPALPWADEQVEEISPMVDLPRVYVPLTNTLTISLAKGGARMEAGLAFAVRGSTQDLVALSSLVQAQIGPIEAAVVRVAQDVVSAGADSASIHRDLPGRLRDAVNGLIGSEDWPAPVEEVLITSLMLR